MFGSLEIVADQVGIILEELVIGKLALEVLQDQVHGQSLRAAGFTSDDEGNLVQNA